MATSLRASVLGRLLQLYCANPPLTPIELAQRMINAGFPSSHYSHFPPGFADDIKWLATTLVGIMSAEFDSPWPFDQHTREFIDAAATAVSTGQPAVHKCLTLACSLDALLPFEFP